MILVLAGGVTAVSQRWDAITGGEQAGVFAAAAVFFLLAGLIVRPVRDPAIQRLGEVTWFLSVAGVGVAAALWVAMDQVTWNKDAVTVLAVGTAVTTYAATLWLVRRSALQSFALFAGLVITIVGVAAVTTARAVTGAVPLPGSVPALPASSLAIAGALWVFGLAWAGLGWRRYVGSVWVTVPCGVVLALVAPGFRPGGTAGRTRSASPRPPRRWPPASGCGTRRCSPWARWRCSATSPRSRPATCISRSGSRRRWRSPGC